jgi:hypothetical protein
MRLIGMAIALLTGAGRKRECTEAKTETANAA